MQKHVEQHCRYVLLQCACRRDRSGCFLEEAPGLFVQLKRLCVTVVLSVDVPVPERSLLNHTWLLRVVHVPVYFKAITRYGNGKGNSVFIGVVVFKWDCLELMRIVTKWAVSPT